MASLAIEIQPGDVRTVSGNVPRQQHVHVLLVSTHAEICQTLCQSLASLCADVMVCSSRAQAEEALSRRVFEVVFCDEHLPDGSYADLIHANHCENHVPRVVVATRTGEWDFYIAAVSNGAFDVIRWPWHARDVEMTLIRALRDEHQPARPRVVV